MGGGGRERGETTIALKKVHRDLNVQLIDARVDQSECGMRE